MKKQKPKKINFSICETEENLNKYKKAALNLSGGNLSVYYSLAAEKFCKSKWQKIASAPKDGTRIILVNQEGCMHIASWSDYSWIAEKQEDGRWGGWLIFACRSDSSRVENPTHWQPLPELPKEEN